MYESSASDLSKRQNLLRIPLFSLQKIRRYGKLSMLGVFRLMMDFQILPLSIGKINMPPGQIPTEIDFLRIDGIPPWVVYC